MNNLSRRRWLTFQLFIVLQLLRVSEQQVSCPGYGNDPAVDLGTGTSSPADSHILIESTGATCHGAIDTWQFYGTDECHDMLFQVWRPATGGGYTLVGSNQYSCPNDTAGSPGQYDLEIPTVEQIPIQPLDVYGWYTDVGSSDRMISFTSALGGSGQYFRTLIRSTTCGDVTGTTCDWTPDTTEQRKYSLDPLLATRPNPYFTNLPATTSVQEEIASVTPVYRVRGYNSFNYNDVLDPDLTYSITTTGCGAGVFTIDATTGEISLTGTTLLDFETFLAAGVSQCTLTIMVAEGTLSSTDNLIIDIQDVNEAHDLTSLPDAVTIDTTRAGIYNLHNLVVTEPDTGPGQPAKTYEIVSSNPPGAPVTISGTQVQNSQDMQYWAGPQYFVVGIICQDGYFASGPKDLTIDITNLREAPILGNLEHVVTVPENSVDDTQVWHTVQGVQQPDEDNSRGDLVYNISNIYPLNVDQALFVIGFTNGEVTHRANPNFDYYTVPQYDVEIYTTYLGPPDYVSDRKNLTVDIQHVNEAPYHQPWAQDLVSTISEKEPLLTTLPGVKLDAYDRDRPNGDWTIYSISGTGSHLFYADNNTGLVYVVGEAIVPAGNIDIVYTMDVYVIDSYGEQDSTTLTVTVTDINDHNPVFWLEPYIGSINEDAVGGTTTGILVSVTDDDGGLNADVRFEIVETIPSLYFQVDTTTNEITNKQPIPYELYPNMTFTLVAMDQGDPVLNDTTQVFIEIIDLNTLVPTFNPDFVSMDLRSDTPVGDIVYTAVAEDADDDQVQDLTYYSLTLDDYFSLAEQTGEISVSRDLVAFEKHLIYIGAQDDTYHSDPFTLRIDTYDPRTTLVDIFLNVPVETFLPTQADFLLALNGITPDWDMRIESVRLDQTDTVVRVYGVESALPDLEVNQDMDKVFVDEDVLIKELRKKLKGTPSDLLTGSEFAQWEPQAVHPAYPIWIVDTPGGVAFLSIMALLALAALITLFVFLAKKYGWCCYKKPTVPRGPKVRRVRPAATGDRDQFKLNYHTDGVDPFYISSNKSLGNTYNPYSGTFSPPPSYKSSSALALPPKPKPKSEAQKNAFRTSMTESDKDRNLPPVQVPNSDWQPYSRPKGGQAS